MGRNRADVSSGRPDGNFLCGGPSSSRVGITNLSCSCLFLDAFRFTKRNSINYSHCIACAFLRYHQYKFIVDGEWRHDETQPFMPDPLGNVNNWLFVRKPESK
jgi:hypothetical protein